MDERILVQKKTHTTCPVYMCWYVLVDTKNDHVHKTLVSH